MPTGVIVVICNNFYMFRAHEWPKHVGVIETYRRLLRMKTISSVWILLVLLLLYYMGHKYFCWLIERRNSDGLHGII